MKISMTVNKTNCAKCPYHWSKKLCYDPDGKNLPYCPTKHEQALLKKSLQEYQKPEIFEFAKQASIQEAEGYQRLEGDNFKPIKPHILEIMEFATKMNYKKLGLIFCEGLAAEAKAVDKLISGKGMIRIASEVGWRRPLNYGMLGIILMSSLDPKNVKRILKKYSLKPYTPMSITDADAFSLRLEQIRDQGYILEKEEAVEGVIGIAAPIRDYSRQVVAALGIALPAGSRNQTKGLDHIVDLIKKTCETISSDLGYLKI